MKICGAVRIVTVILFAIAHRRGARRHAGCSIFGARAYDSECGTIPQQSVLQYIGAIRRAYHRAAGYRTKAPA